MCIVTADKNNKLNCNVYPNKQRLMLIFFVIYFKIAWLLGGSLIFDEADIELQAENILITDGGVLQVCERTWGLFLGNLSLFLKILCVK